MGIDFLDQRGLVFELASERLYLLLLPRDSCLQALNCAIEHSLPGSVGHGLGRDAFGRKSTRIRSIGSKRAPSSIGIDHYHNSCRSGNRRTKNIVDSAPVTDLPKNTVHTGVVSDDDVIIGAGDSRACHLTYGNVVTISNATLERLITNGCVVVSSSIGSKRFPPSGSVGAAADIVRQSKVTSGSV